LKVEDGVNKRGRDVYRRIGRENFKEWRGRMKQKAGGWEDTYS
jgi:hypothetical protein